jgi:minor histocompatibility antigen H13
MHLLLRARAPGLAARPANNTRPSPMRILSTSLLRRDATADKQPLSPGDSDAAAPAPSAAAAAAAAASANDKSPPPPPRLSPGDSDANAPAPSAAAAAAGAAAAAAPPWNWEESADAPRAYGALLAVLLSGKLLGAGVVVHSANPSSSFLDLPYFIGLALCVVYIGAHRGLTTKQRQQMSLKEGALAPLVASAALFGVYLVIRYFPDLDLRTLLSGYFFLLTGGATLSAAVPTLRTLGGGGGEEDGGSGLGSTSLRLPVPEGLLLDDHGEPVASVALAPTDALAAALALALAAAGAASWAQPMSGGGGSLVDFSINNLAACLIAADILQLVGLRSFRAATLLLCGLLAYDVTWVFASPLFSPGNENVMLEVATSDQIVGPTRLLFPRAAQGAVTAAQAMREGASFPFSLLGLGDVAVPGLLACLALRFDATRAVDMPRRAAAAIAAMRATLAEMDAATATAEELGAAGGRAAAEAFDRVADAETRARARAQDQEGGGGGMVVAEEGAAAAAAAAAGELEAVVIAPSETVLMQRPYFTAVLAAHAAGLLVAFAANSITGLGQPALLYIVPTTLGAVAATALSRGEIGRVWRFTDVASFGPAQALIEREREEKKRKKEAASKR